LELPRFKLKGAIFRKTYFLSRPAALSDADDMTTLNISLRTPAESYESMQQRIG
jgi:hypothetical protein